MSNDVESDENSLAWPVTVLARKAHGMSITWTARVSVVIVMVREEVRVVLGLGWKDTITTYRIRQHQQQHLQ